MDGLRRVYVVSTWAETYETKTDEEALELARQDFIGGFGKDENIKARLNVIFNSSFVEIIGYTDTRIRRMHPK